jgi:hypothetical protein
LFEAKTLLHVARGLCPEAAFEIDKAVTLARPFQNNPTAPQCDYT